MLVSNIMPECLPAGRQGGMVDALDLPLRQAGSKSFINYKFDTFMYYVYAIKSLSRNYIYVGISDNVERRLDQHQKGYNKTTKPYTPFTLIFTEKCGSRVEARKREKYLKSGSGKEFLKSL